VQVLDGLRRRLEAVAAGEVVVEVLAARAHAADVERQLRLHAVEARLHIVADEHAHADGDVEVANGLAAAGLREALVERRLIDLRRAVGRVEDGQPAIGDLGRLGDALRPDGRQIDRDRPAVEDALERLPEPARTGSAIRDVVVLAVMLERTLARPDGAQDLDVLARADQRLSIPDAVPAFDDLRSRYAEAAEETAAREMIERH